MRFRGLAALAWLAAAQGHAEAPAGAELRISLLTMGPGEIYWQRFGHNALLVRGANGTTKVYNYGMFDFGEKNFFLNFARGRMSYWLGEFSLDRTLHAYAREGRWVHEQQLALNKNQSRALADFLAWNALPENASYRYDYFIDNCSTRVRDAIDRASGGALRAQLEGRATQTTYRKEVLRLMSPQPLLMLGMDLGLGPRVDRPINQWQHSFIPMVLMDALHSVNLNAESQTQRPLVLSERRLVQAGSVEEPSRAPKLVLQLGMWGSSVAMVLMMLGVFWRSYFAKRAFTLLSISLALVCGLTGLVLLAGWTLTEHWGMADNQNLLLFNPLLLLLLPALWRGGQHVGLGEKALALATAGLVIVALLLNEWAPVQQANAHWIILMAPIHLALFAVLGLGDAYRNKRT